MTDLLKIKHLDNAENNVTYFLEFKIKCENRSTKQKKTNLKMDFIQLKKF